MNPRRRWQQKCAITRLRDKGLVPTHNDPVVVNVLQNESPVEEKAEESLVQEEEVMTEVIEQDMIEDDLLQEEGDQHVD